MQAGLQQIMRAGMHVEAKQWRMLTYAHVCSRMLTSAAANDARRHAGGGEAAAAEEGHARPRR